jgi:hypothetical protein
MLNGESRRVVVSGGRSDPDENFFFNQVVKGGGAMSFDRRDFWRTTDNSLLNVTVWN